MWTRCPISAWAATTWTRQEGRGPGRHGLRPTSRLASLRKAGGASCSAPRQSKQGSFRELISKAMPSSTSAPAASHTPLLWPPSWQAGRARLGRGIPRLPPHLLPAGSCPCLQALPMQIGLLPLGNTAPCFQKENRASIFRLFFFFEEIHRRACLPKR